MRRLISGILAGLLVIAGMAITPLVRPETALANRATVTACTEAELDSALAAAHSSGATITFDCAGTITFTGQKSITGAVKVVGNGQVVFDGGDSTRLFQVTTGGRLSLYNLTLQNGNAGAEFGGAIFSDGALEIVDSVFTANNAESGGAIYNGDTATITASSFSGNTADGAGGAIRNGAPQVSAFLTATASTFSGNTAGFGGAIYNDGQSTSTRTTLNSSTFSSNSAAQGGAIMSRAAQLNVTASTFSGNSGTQISGALYFLGSASTTNGFTGTIRASTFSGNRAILTFGSGVVVSSSILAGSSDVSNCASLDATPPVSQGYNIVDDGSCNFTEEGDQEGAGVTMNLGALQDNGGPTATILPQSGSDAIGAIPPAACAALSSATGQRGVSRPQDTNCEIGAVELGQVPPQILAAYNDGPVYQSEPVTIGIVASGPAGDEPNYGVDCDNDGNYEAILIENTWTCTFPQPGDHVVGVAASDGSVVAESETLVTVLAVTPEITALDLDPTPSDEGEAVTLTTSYSNSSPTATHVCEIDWGDGTVEPGVVSEPGGSGTCSGSHVYADNTSHAVNVEVCNTDACDEASSNHTVNNVAPTIEQVAADPNPVPQGEPVIVTVTASDPGVADVLTYSFDCDDDGIYETGPQAEPSTVCAFDPRMAGPTVNVLVDDDDGGSVTGSITISQTTTLCANRYTGGLSTPLANGSCPDTSVTLALPDEDGATLCIHPYTGQLTWAPRGACSPVHRVHSVPDDGPLDYCRNAYTGKLRYTATGACSPVEGAGVIPG